MVNSISSAASSVGTMRSADLKGPPPPRNKDVFQVGDTDGDGLISAAELTALIESIEEATGNSMEIDGVLNSYDTDQNGGLSGEELLEMLKSKGLAPPEMMSPSQPSTESALAAYEKNSGESQIAELLELLTNSDPESDRTSVDIKA